MAAIKIELEKCRDGLMGFRSGAGIWFDSLIPFIQESTTPTNLLDAANELDPDSVSLPFRFERSPHFRGGYKLNYGIISHCGGKKWSSAE